MIDFDVVCNDREHYGNGPHAHQDDMLFIPLDGIFSVATNAAERQQVIASGTVWFVPSRCVHRVEASTAQRHLCYYVDMPSLPGHSGVDLTGSPSARYWMTSAFLADLVRLRQHFAQHRVPTSGLTGQSVDQMILEEVGRIVSTTTSTLSDNESQRVITEVRQFIAGHLDADLRCGVLAARFHINERTLARWFKVHENQSLGHYVQCARLQEARHLLHGTSLPIADIQAAVGFSSAAHFAYAIRTAFGHSPSGLREGDGQMAENR